MLKERSRRLAAEALLIAEGKSVVAPTAEHLKVILALGHGCRAFSETMQRTQLSLEYKQMEATALAVSGIQHEAIATTA